MKRPLLVALSAFLVQTAYGGLGVYSAYADGSGPLYDGSWIFIALIFIAGGILFWVIAVWIINKLWHDTDSAISIGGFVGGIAWILTFIKYYDEIVRAGSIIILCAIAYVVIKSVFFEK